MGSVSRTPCEVMRENYKAYRNTTIAIVNDKTNGLGGVA
jgi:hypothetical protein